MRPLVASAVFSALIAAAACASTANSGTVVEPEVRTGPDRAVEVDPSGFLYLSDFLIRLPGVYVSNTGPNAMVTFRGRRPLFVVDGTPIMGGYASANGLVPPQDVASVSVLNSIEATTQFGRLGGNGAIVIATKRG